MFSDTILVGDCYVTSSTFICRVLPIGTYLLGLPFSGISKFAKQLISYILLAARMAIPLCWSTEPPTMSLLINIIADIRRMEYLTIMVSETLLQFNNALEVWDQSENGLPFPLTPPLP